MFDIDFSDMIKYVFICTEWPRSLNSKIDIHLSHSLTSLFSPQPTEKHAHAATEFHDIIFCICIMKPKIIRMLKLFKFSIS